VFARTVLDLGGALEVVVPAEQYRDGLDPDEQHGYDELLAKTKHVEWLPFVESTEQAHLAARQKVVDRSQCLVAVWDKPARGVGGTADIVNYACQKGVPVAVLWPEVLHASRASLHPASQARSPGQASRDGKPSALSPRQSNGVRPFPRFRTSASWAATPFGCPGDTWAGVSEPLLSWEFAACVGRLVSTPG
jgi:hypothetical protein